MNLLPFSTPVVAMMIRRLVKPAQWRIPAISAYVSPPTITTSVQPPLMSGSGDGDGDGDGDGAAAAGPGEEEGEDEGAAAGEGAGEGLYVELSGAKQISLSPTTVTPFFVTLPLRGAEKAWSGGGGASRLSRALLEDDDVVVVEGRAELAGRAEELPKAGEGEEESAAGSGGVGSDSRIFSRDNPFAAAGSMEGATVLAEVAEEEEAEESYERRYA